MKRINSKFKFFGGKFKTHAKPKVAKANKKGKHFYSKSIAKVKKRPILSFVLLLGLLLALILASNFVNKPESEIIEEELLVKEVQVYVIGESPVIPTQAKIEKSGVINIVSLGAGVVQRINTEVGQAVSRGKNILSMSTNYQGGNAFSVQRQLAQVTYKNVLETFDTQKDIIAKQREIAQKSDQNSEELRKITDDSLTSTRNLIDLNSDILSTLETNQKELEDNNVGGANDALILQTKQLRSQFESANNQLESGLRAAEYTRSGDNPPAEISTLSKDLILKQLEVQEKALELNKEVSRLNVVLMQINEAIMFPSAPIAGIVERIYVKEGQVVNPGTLLAKLNGQNESFIAVALLNNDMADGISRSKVSTLRIGDKTFHSVPFFVSGEPTDGKSFSAHFSIPEEYNDEVSDGSYITIEIPIDFPKTSGTIPFIPIDSVYQTQDNAFIFVAVDGIAKSREVKLGNVIGRFVEVKEGLGKKDQVILNRNIIDGDPVKIVN